MTLRDSTSTTSTTAYILANLPPSSLATSTWMTQMSSPCNIYWELFRRLNGWELISTPQPFQFLKCGSTCMVDGKEYILNRSNELVGTEEVEARKKAGKRVVQRWSWVSCMNVACHERWICVIFFFKPLLFVFKQNSPKFLEWYFSNIFDFQIYSSGRILHILLRVIKLFKSNKFWLFVFNFHSFHYFQFKTQNLKKKKETHVCYCVNTGPTAPTL